jgi:hypothetical protein
MFPDEISGDGIIVLDGQIVETVYYWLTVVPKAGQSPLPMKPPTKHFDGVPRPSQKNAENPPPTIVMPIRPTRLMRHCKKSY